MMKRIIYIVFLSVMSWLLLGCAATKVVSLPLKGVYQTGKLGGKGVIGTTKLTGKGLYNTGKFAGKSVYFLGKTPVHISKNALDASVKTLNVSAQVMTIAGTAAMIQKEIKSSELDAYLMGMKGATNIVGIFVKAASAYGKKRALNQIASQNVPIKAPAQLRAPQPLRQRLQYPVENMEILSPAPTPYDSETLHQENLQAYHQYLQQFR